MPKPVKGRHTGLHEIVKKTSSANPIMPRGKLYAHFVMPEVQSYLLRKLKLPEELHKKARANLANRERLMGALLTIGGGKTIKKRTAIKLVENAIADWDFILEKVELESGALQAAKGKIKGYQRGLLDLKKLEDNYPVQVAKAVWEDARDANEAAFYLLIGTKKAGTFTRASNRSAQIIYERIKAK